MSTRFSQQPTLTATSFLAQQREPQPHDNSVPDKTWHSHLSNSGSPSSGSADVAMCPPVGDAAGDGFTSTGVPAGTSASLEVFIRELAVRQTEQFTILTNRIADIQRQLREHTDVFNRTTEWMRSEQARSVDIVRSHSGLSHFGSRRFCQQRQLLLFDSLGVGMTWRNSGTTFFTTSSESRPEEYLV